MEKREEFGEGIVEKVTTEEATQNFINLVRERNEKSEGSGIKDIDDQALGREMTYARARGRIKKIMQEEEGEKIEGAPASVAEEVAKIKELRQLHHEVNRFYEEFSLYLC